MDMLTQEAFKPVENFYEFISAQLMTDARQQDRTCSRESQFCNLLYAFEIKEET